MRDPRRWFSAVGLFSDFSRSVPDLSRSFPDFSRLFSSSLENDVRLPHGGQVLGTMPFARDNQCDLVPALRPQVSM